MSSAPTIIVEPHRSASTLYATGELTTAAVLEAVACVERLPEHVRALCVDLRGVRRTDSHALRVLDLALRTWRAFRRGMTRVKPAQDMETSLVAIRFAHQRWTPSLREPVRLLGGLAAFDSGTIARPS
jgi:ABC-type transporter Mla MlaB component